MDKITLEMLDRVEDAFGVIHKAMGVIKAHAFGEYAAGHIKVKTTNFDDGFERAHENPETEQPCTLTAVLEIKGDNE